MSLLPMFNKENSSTKDKIISVLAANPALNTKKIFNLLKKQYAMNVTYQAIHKTLKQMVEEGILVFDSKTYSINDKWVKILKNFVSRLEKIPQDNVFEQKIAEIFEMEQNTSLNLELKNLNQLFSFLKRFEIDYCNLYNDDIIVAGQIFHSFDFFSDIKSKNNLTKYFLCKGNTVIDNLAVIKNRNKQTFIRTNVKGITKESYIYGDYIIEINVLEKFIKKLDAHFESIRNIPDLNIEEFQTIFEKTQDIFLTIQKNRGLAKYQRLNILDQYPGPFEGLIKDMKKQKGSIYHVDIRYLYLTQNQIFFYDTVLRERKDKVAVYPKEIELIDKYAGKLVFDKYEDKLNILELGPGDCQKTIKILSRWLPKYPNLKYTGIEISKELIDRGNSNLSLTFPSLKYNLLNQDFDDYVKNYVPGQEPKVIMLLGFKYGNFQNDMIEEWLKKIVEKNDILIIVMQILKDESQKEMSKVMQKFNFKESRQSNLSTLCELGFIESDFDFKVEYNKKEHRLEGIATIKHVPKNLIPKMKEIEFKIGDKVILFYSWKPTLKQLNKTLSKNYYPEFHYDDETGLVMAMLRKKSGVKLFVDSVMIKMVEGERGIFATASIKKGTKIFDYKGELSKIRTKHTLQVDENKHLVGQLIFDHSCNANCKIDWKTFEIISDRDIKKDEKLTFNYLTSEEELSNPFKCYCGEPNCKILIKGFKYLSRREKKELKPYLSSFLLKKYKEELDS